MKKHIFLEKNTIGFFLFGFFFRRQALEGVQKDVRRTVSVMQYNILAS